MKKVTLPSFLILAIVFCFSLLSVPCFAEVAPTSSEAEVAPQAVSADVTGTTNVVTPAPTPITPQLSPLVGPNDTGVVTQLEPTPQFVAQNPTPQPTPAPQTQVPRLATDGLPPVVQTAADHIAYLNSRYQRVNNPDGSTDYFDNGVLVARVMGDHENNRIDYYSPDGSRSGESYLYNSLSGTLRYSTPPDSR